MMSSFRERKYFPWCEESCLNSVPITDLLCYLLVLGVDSNVPSPAASLGMRVLVGNVL